MSSCGASFQVITDETDSLMAAYGIAQTSDTVNVCESWTGSDYQWQVAGAGSSDNVSGFEDTVQTVTYDGGYVAGYTQSGNAAADPVSVGTSFDFMLADNSTRQASYDDPYYGISSHDPSTCLQPPCPLTTRIGQSYNSSPSTVNAPASATANVIADTLFNRYGLTRRGVRALVNESAELAPSAKGYRRFRSVKESTTTTRSVDPVTQLLMIEEFTTGEDDLIVTHKWTKVVGGYVLDRSDYTSLERVDGKTLHNFGSVVLKNVRVADPAYPPLSLPTP